MSNYLSDNDVRNFAEMIGDLQRQVAQLKKRASGGVTVIDDGETAAPADPPPSFWRDRYPTDPPDTLSGTAASVTLTYTPLLHSLHLYLNGLELDEGSDYTLADNVVTFTAASPGSGDVLDARYAFTDSTPETAVVYPALTITDTFNRADGSSGFADRSDGGTWDLTADAAGKWIIEDNQAIKNTEGGSPQAEWVSADYGDINEVSAEVVITWTGERFYEKASIYLAVTDDPNAFGDGAYYLNFEAIEGYFQIGKNTSGGSTSWAGGVGSTSTWGTGPRTLKLTFNKTTGEVKAYFDGALILSHTDGSPLTGTRFAFNYEDERAYLIDSITVEST